MSSPTMTRSERLIEVAVAAGLTALEVKSSKTVRADLATAAGLQSRVGSDLWRVVVDEVAQANERAARAHSLESGRCKPCGAPLRWVTTENGKSMSLDPLPRPNGNVVLVPKGRSVLAHVVPHAQLPVVGRPAYQSHFASCPFADEMRRRRAASRSKSGEKVPVCPVCDYRLHPWLVENAYTVHPGCEEI